MGEQVRAEDAAQADDPADDATQEQAQAVKQAKAAKATKATETPASAADSRSGTVTKQDVKEVQKQHAAQFEPMDLAHARFVWAPAVMLASSMDSSLSISSWLFTQVPGLSEKEERTWTGTPSRRAYSTQRRCRILAPLAAISSMSS